MTDRPPAVTPDSRGTIDRLYVLDGGEAQVQDISQWSPGVDAGQPRTFSNNVYLLQHGDQWMVWDTGIDERLIDTPGGEIIAHAVRGVVSRTLTAQLRELGIDPREVALIAFSHGHFDHVGNSGLFPNATWYVQRPEHEAMFGPDHTRYGFIPSLYASMPNNPIEIVDGDHDLFGDRSVQIISTPGHTPGHQSLLIQLPETGPVVLSGDVAHFQENFRHRRVPSFNADHAQTLRSMDRIDALLQAEGAVLWINHDAGQSATIPHAPDAVR